MARRLMASSTTNLRETLARAGCTPEEIDGWSKEMIGWQDHTIKVFVDKLAVYNRKEVPSVAKAVAEAAEERPTGVFVNPLTGEVGGPRGPEPTRHGDWSYKGRCTDF